MDRPSAQPDISVIIASYNVQGYIERAIRSALDQEGVQVEVILVDDASTDKTVEVAARIADPRIKIIRRPANGGPSATRNEGIAAATGAWIAILDGDDAFAPGRLVRCLRYAGETKAHIVIDNLDVWREADQGRYRMFHIRDFGPHKTLDLPTFIRGNASFLGGTSLGYVKPLFAAGFLRRHHLAYDNDIRIGEDYMLMAEALACGARCAVEPNAGYLYTVRAGSISHRLRTSDIDRIETGDRKFLAKYNLDAGTQKAQKHRESRLRQARAFIELIDYLKARKFYAALGTMLRHPSSILSLWRPASARIARLSRKAL